MTRQEKFDVTIPQAFQPTWNRFLEIISTDKEYQDLIKKKQDSDKRFRNKDNKCAKVRFAIGFYTKNKRLEMVKNKKEGEIKQ